MGDNVFRFKKFAVNQSRSAMKIGTDGVLLGAWCEVDKANHILDVGCGTGLISLMLAQKNATADIKAIDIDSAAVDEANGNFSNSQWADRLSAKVCNYAEYDNSVKFDAIVSNPPFYTERVYSPDDRRSAARQCESLPFEVLFRKSFELLTECGTLSIITPANCRELVEYCAGESDFWLKRRTEVLTKRGKMAKRILWEFSKSEVKPGRSQLIINGEDGQKTEEYISLTNTFYLY